MVTMHRKLKRLLMSLFLPSEKCFELVVCSLIAHILTTAVKFLVSEFCFSKVRSL